MLHLGKLSISSHQRNVVLFIFEDSDAGCFKCPILISWFCSQMRYTIAQDKLMFFVDDVLFDGPQF